MRSKSPSARAPSPSLRNGVPGKTRKASGVPLEGLARLSTDVFTENLEPSAPFKGVVICVTGFSRDARKEVQVTTERMGGQYSRDLHVNCTHLVVQNCSGRKYDHAVKHGVHRGLHIVTMSWWEDCVKQNKRLDETLYMVPRSGNHPADLLPEAVGSSNNNTTTTNNNNNNNDNNRKVARRKFPSADHDMEATVRLQPISTFAHSSGGSLRNSSSMPRTPHSSSLATDKSSHALAGARFYIDPDLPRDLQLKSQESAESWGATCVENWSKATHVVCESETVSKYIGLNLHLVSPMWVMSARDGFPLRCVQYSADLARDVADLLLEWKKKGPNNSNKFLEDYTLLRNGKTDEVTLQDREKKAIAAKEGVRRRRGNRMQPCRTLPRPNTPASLLDSIFWVISDAPSTAQLYTNSTGVVVAENSENGAGQYGIRFQDPLDEALGTEIYTKPLSRSDRREIVFRGPFLTILFPMDRFSELGPSAQTFFIEAGFTREQILEIVHAFYQEPLSPSEVDAAIHTDSKHADRLRALYASAEVDQLGYVPMQRHQFLGSRLQFEGLKRANQEPTSHIYDLWLGS